MGKRGLRLITLAAIPVLVLSACSTATSTAGPSATDQASTGASAAPSVAVTLPGTVKWFVGLGSGTQPNQIADQNAFVANYNKTNKDGITIKLDIEPNATANAILKTDIVAGNIPDIIGPVGTAGRVEFQSQFLDLTTEIAKNNYNLKAFPDALVKFFNNAESGQFGIPYDVFPGYIWYNKDSFAKAGLPALPTTVGAQYEGKTWDWAELGTIAAQLTLDKNNKKSTDAGFDKTNIVKYGMDFQWCDGRRIASLFGGGSFVDTDGHTAVIPAAWSDAFNWYYDAIWKGNYVPNGAALASALLGSSNGQSSGNVAMNAAWGWSIGSIWDGTTKTAKMKNWDMGVIPSWKGTTTSPLDSDTFVITKSSKNQDAAFKAMVAIEADKTLMADYGGEPAVTADQAAYYTAFDATMAPIFSGNKVTWSVLGEMLKYPAVPSHEALMPANKQAIDDYTAFMSKLNAKSGLDVNAELVTLQKTLQTDFNTVQPLT
jgi:multiple sugar transport system substrate-binding protein